MAVALDASSPTAVYGDTQANTSLATTSFTPPAGSILIVYVVSADAGQTHSTPTATSHTFVSRANLGTANSTSRVSVWTATATGSALTITAPFAGTATQRALVVSAFSGAQLAATPAVATFDGTSVANSAPSLNITTVAANSMVSWALGDWAQIDGTTTRVYRSSATERAFHTVTGAYTGYAAYQAAATAGTQTFGLTAPTGQKPTMVGIEIQASGGAAAATPIRRIGKRTW